ncbi:hypothetical protein FV139_19440 [Parahaliea maris]|uniref:Uncharacterized protein n=1 Tax=Parahaliea maris TaxID=2716870 RepID=A0A5C8ZRD1_9GAMM|nr:polysaccharide biosynthesis C-terminal domain-containing protein [Parahaliea maris]TXS89901.1 hypothetical protein FV139_19440 [Parahaliea maris]
MISLWQRIGNRDLLSRSALAMALKVLSSVCMLGFNLLVVHHYQPGIAGEFFLCVTLVLITSQVARFGMDNVLVRRVSVLVSQQDHASLSRLCSSALLATLLAGLGLAALLHWSAGPLSATLFSNPGMAPMVAIMALATPFYALCLLTSYINQGLGRVPLHIISLNLGQVSIASLLLVVAVQAAGMAPSATLLGTCYVGGCALMMLYTLVATGRRVALRPASARANEALPLIRESAPLYMVALTQLVMVWSSQLLLGVWAEPADVAVYTIAQRVAMVTSFVLVAVNSVVAPRFAVLYHDGKLAELEALSRLSVRMMLAMATPLLLLMLLFPQWILAIFGTTYSAGAAVLIVLALGQFVNVVTGPVGYLLQMSGHYREVRNNTLIAAVTALALNALLTPRHGAMGAAIAAAVALSVVNLLGLWQVRKNLGFRLAPGMA